MIKNKSLRLTRVSLFVAIIFAIIAIENTSKYSNNLVYGQDVPIQRTIKIGNWMSVFIDVGYIQQKYL